MESLAGMPQGVRKSHFRSGDLFDSSQHTTVFEVELRLEGGEWKQVKKFEADRRTTMAGNLFKRFRRKLSDWQGIFALLCLAHQVLGLVLVVFKIGSPPLGPAVSLLGFVWLVLVALSDFTLKVPDHFDLYPERRLLPAEEVVRRHYEKMACLREQQEEDMLHREPEPGTVTLLSGAQLPESMIEIVMIALRQLFHPPDPTAIPATLSALDELVTHCWHPEHRISPQATRILIERGLLESNGRLHYATKHIVTSAVAGEGLNMVLLESPILRETERTPAHSA